MESILLHKKEILDLANEKNDNFNDFNEYLAKEYETNGGLLHPNDIVFWYQFIAKEILNVIYDNKETLNITQVDLVHLDEYLEQAITRIDRVDNVSFLYSLQQNPDTCSRSRRQQYLQELLELSEIGSKYSFYSSGVCGSFGSFKIK